MFDLVWDSWRGLVLLDNLFTTGTVSSLDIFTMTWNERDNAAYWWIAANAISFLSLEWCICLLMVTHDYDDCLIRTESGFTCQQGFYSLLWGRNFVGISQEPIWRTWMFHKVLEGTREYLESPCILSLYFKSPWKQIIKFLASLYVLPPPGPRILRPTVKSSCCAYTSRSTAAE